MSNKKQAVLAFSGGLDTSFCVPYLIEKGYDVITLLVDTGGFEGDGQNAHSAGVGGVRLDRAVHDVSLGAVEGAALVVYVLFAGWVGHAISILRAREKGNTPRAVVGLIAGVRSIEHLEEYVDLLRVDIPTALWDDLRSSGLLAQSAPVPS